MPAVGPGLPGLQHPASEAAACLGHAGREVTLTCPRLRRLLSRESPSGAMKAVLRKAGSAGAGEEKQFLEVGADSRGQWGSACESGSAGAQAA